MSIVRILFSSGVGVMKNTKTALHNSHFHLASQGVDGLGVLFWKCVVYPQVKATWKV